MSQDREKTGRTTSRWRRVGIGCSVVALAATGVVSAQADPAAESGQRAYPAKVAIDGRDRPTNDAKRTTDVYLAGDQVEVKCQTEGDEVGGSRLWIYTSKNYYIPDYLVKTGTDGFIPGVPRCEGEKPPPSSDTGPRAYSAKVAIDGRDRPTNDAKRTTDVYLAGDQVEVKCQTEGDEVGGSRLWIYTSKNYYIPDYLVKTGTDGFIPGVPRCEGENPPPQDEPTPPANKKPRVVAMGDSYASGEGTFHYDGGTDVKGVNECHRSPQSWQRNLNLPGLGVSSSANPDIDYQQVACSGAVTDNVLHTGQWGEPKQLDALQGHEDYVLLSIGGNDLGFSDIVQRCIKKVFPCWSMPEVRDTKNKINRFLAPGGAFERTITAIHREAPRAKIVLAGYPQLFGQPVPAVKGCTGITRDEALYVDGLASYLRTETGKRVQNLRGQGMDLRYAETISTFNGHEACTGLGAQWINSLLKPLAEEGPEQQPEMFHPSRKGQQAYVRAVQKVL